MPKFEVRNRRTRMVLGEVVCADAADVLGALKEATGSSIDEIALSLGSTIEEAMAALDVVDVDYVPLRPLQAALPRRRLYG